VANGDGGEFSHYLRAPSGTWTRLTQNADEITHAVFGPDNALYLLSHHDAPRGQILRLPLATPRLAAATAIIATPATANPARAFAAATRAMTRPVTGNPPGSAMVQMPMIRPRS